MAASIYPFAFFLSSPVLPAFLLRLPSPLAPALFPRRETVVLVLFLPVRMKARTLALFLGGLTILDAALLQSQVAYAAHLAGGAAGYLYGLALVRRRALFRLAG